MKFIINTLKSLIVIIFVLIAIYILSLNFNILGNNKFFIVQSGSMEPSIMTGDVIAVQKKKNYEINDVITFQGDSARVITHRIFRIEKTDEGNEEEYLTKGDSNRLEDEDLVLDKQVIGKVVLVIPNLGYLMNFAKSRLGIIFLLLIPSIIFILDELIKIRKNVKKRN
ncbi:signal peptidase I [Patescibacteria group bacterium]|nr:signal peptidase I [Patescibacteria group bacterium]